jgi:hypothetical protein
MWSQPTKKQVHLVDPCIPERLIQPPDQRPRPMGDAVRPCLLPRMAYPGLVSWVPLPGYITSKGLQYRTYCRRTSFPAVTSERLTSSQNSVSGLGLRIG